MNFSFGIVNSSLVFCNSRSMHACTKKTCVPHLEVFLVLDWNLYLLATEANVESPFKCK